MHKTFVLLALAVTFALGCSSKDDDTDQVTHECPATTQDAGTDAAPVDDAATEPSDAGDTDAAPVDPTADAAPPADAAAE